MEDSTPIYIFIIQHGQPNLNYFVYAANDPSYEKALINCEILYDFIQQPLLVTHVLPVSHILDVDVMVKKLMWKYGFDCVRGGSYHNKALTDRELQFLYNEYDNAEYSLLSDGKIIDKLDAHHRPEELEDPYYLHFEEWELHKKYLKYSEEKEKMLQFRKCSGNAILGRHFLDDIDWLQIFLDCEYEEGEKLLTTTKDEYKRILTVLHDIMAKFVEYGYSEKILSEYLVFYKHPEFFLDPFFYHRRNIRDWSKDITIARDHLRFFKYMCYTIINRLEEMEFDILEYPANFEKEYEVTMKYYQYWRNECMIKMDECD
jgi:hypothetical protein